MSELTTKNVRALLDCYKAIYPRVENIKQAMVRGKMSAEDIEAAALKQTVDGLPHPTGAGDKTANIAIKMAEGEANAPHLQAEMERLLYVEKQIVTGLGGLPMGEREVLHLRFVQGLGWEDVAAKLGIEKNDRNAAYKAYNAREKAAIERLTPMLQGTVSVEDCEKVCGYLGART